MKQRSVSGRVSARRKGCAKALSAARGPLARRSVPFDATVATRRPRPFAPGSFPVLPGARSRLARNIL